MTPRELAQLLPLGWLLCYLAAMSLWTLLLCGWDKSRAKRGGRRTPERTLLSLGACGGAFGLLLGMRLFRHKTLHLRFRLLAPLFCLLWLLLICLVAL